MGESPFLRVIRVWGALAWADGVIAPQEAIALNKLIDNAELTDAERTTARGFLTKRIELDTSELSGLSTEVRGGIYRAACRMAAVDQDVAATERAFLEKLREGLAIPAEVARKIEAEVPGLAAK